MWFGARAGDANAFAEIYDLHRDRVFGHALRLVRNPHDAEDVTAVAFLELWRRRASVEAVDGTVVGWLLVTTNFVVRNFERARRRYRDSMDKLPPAIAVPDHSDDVADLIDRQTPRAVVHAAFLQLTRRDQDVLTLCVLEELSEEQASAALGVPRGTVKSRLSRAKARLAGIVLKSGSPIDWEVLANGR